MTLLVKIEECWSDKDYYQYCVDNGIKNDPLGSSSGTYRVILDGSWAGSAHDCRADNRSMSDPNSANLGGSGFRVIISTPED